MPDDRIQLAVELNKSSADQIKQWIGDVEQGFTRLDRATAKVGQTADRAGKELVDGIRASRTELEAAGKAADDLGSKVQKASKVDIGLSGLRRTGGALSQLGLGEAGGAVSRAGDVGQIAKEAGELTAALGPLAPALVVGAGAVVGFKVGTEVLTRQLEASSKALQQSSNDVKLYYQFIQKGTTDTLNKQIELAKQTKYFADEEVKTRQKALEAVKINEGDSILTAGVKLFTSFSGDVEKLRDDLDEASKRSQDASTQIRTATQATGSFNVKLNDFSDALNKKVSQGLQLVIDLTKRYAEEQAKLGASLRKAGDIEIDRIKADQRTNNELLSFTYAQAQQRIKSIEDEKAINDKIILTRGLANSQLDRNSDAYKKNVEDIKAATAANENLNRELNSLTGALNNLPAELEARDKRLTEVQSKYNQETEAAEKRTAERKTEIQKRYVDATISATERLRDSTTAALRQLEQAREDLRTGLTRDLSKEDRESLDKELAVQINSHREEQQALTEHLRRLQQIRDSANTEQIKDLLEGNFLGLFESRLQVKGQVKSEDSSYGAREAEIQTQQAQEVEDLKRSVQIQRRERLIAYEQAKDDARLAYRREIDQAEEANRIELQRAGDARRRNLQDLNIVTVQETNIRRAAYEAQLKLANLFGVALVAADKKRFDALLAQSRSGLSGGSTQQGATRTYQQVTAHRALGGPLTAGQFSEVQEGFPGQRESFNGVPFPAGPGLFFPLQSGSVGASGGDKVIHATFNITSHDPQGVRAEVIGFMEKMVKR